MSIGAAFALVIFPPACGMTLLVSELAFATRAKREAVEQGRLPSGLPFYLCRFSFSCRIDLLMTKDLGYS
jgi:hypothetical protein